MNQPVRLTWHALEPAFPVLELMAIFGSYRLFHVTNAAVGVGLAAGIGIVLMSVLVWLAHKDQVPGRHTLIRRSYLPWGITFIVLGALAPRIGVQYMGAGLVVLGVIYLAVGVIAIARKETS